MGITKHAVYAAAIFFGLAIGRVPHAAEQHHYQPILVTTEAQPEPPAPLPNYQRGKDSSVHLLMQAAGCTGTVYGKSKHVILTALHCVGEGGPLEMVDGQKVTARVMSVDGHDHVFIHVDQTMTKPGATIGPMPAPGTEVYIWGNPSDMESQLRIGHIAGVWSYEGDLYDTIDINTWHGDSGGAFFDQTGHIVAITLGHDEDRDGNCAVADDLCGTWKMAIVQPFAFTPAQLREAEGG